MPYRQQNSRRNLQAANCTSVKIELQLRSKTSEISLKCLTCCDKSRATISSICSSPSCSLLGWCFGSFARCWTTHDLFSLSLQKCFSSQKKTALHPFFNLSQLHCENQGCAAVTPTMPPTPPPHAPPPTRLGKLCQWSSSGSADWQARWRVTNKSAPLSANGRRGWSIVIRLPRQPPLNEFVQGMWPDGCYITG